MIYWQHIIRMVSNNEKSLQPSVNSGTKREKQKRPRFRHWRTVLVTCLIFTHFSLKSENIIL